MSNGTEPRTCRSQVWVGSLPILSHNTPPPHTHTQEPKAGTMVNMKGLRHEGGGGVVRVRPQPLESSDWFSAPSAFPGFERFQMQGLGKISGTFTQWVWALPKPCLRKEHLREGHGTQGF